MILFNAGMRRTAAAGELYTLIYKAVKGTLEYGILYYLRLVEDYQWCELGVNVFSESYK